MLLYSFQAKGGNFGDDLNLMLWPRLLGKALGGDDGRVFVGIGSILDTRLDDIEGAKVIFGTGINSQRSLPNFGSHYDIRFVRGPISAHAIGSECPWIADSALAVRLLKWSEVKQAHDVGFMPHFLTLPYADWRRICQDLGMRFLNPQAPVEELIEQLRSCKTVITEAMHGAIIADAFRIPWLRVTINAWQKEDFDFSALKWLDWGLAIAADVTPVYLEPLHPWRRRMFVNPVRLYDRLRAEREIVKTLERLKKTAAFRLSNESLLNEAVRRISEEVGLLKTGAVHCR